MQKLIDTIIKGFSISIKDIRLSDEKNLIVVVRFFNTREVRQKLAIEESRMISQNIRGSCIQKELDLLT